MHGDQNLSSPIYSLQMLSYISNYTIMHLTEANTTQMKAFNATLRLLLGKKIHIFLYNCCLAVVDLL